jgi:hypothetical protein
MSAVLAVAFSGCASVVNGRYQPINVTTNPSNANCIIDENWRFTTPSIISVQRGWGHDIVCEKDGLVGEGRVRGKTNYSLVAGNILFGLIPGIIVDDMTSGNKEFDRAIKIDLQAPPTK